MDRKMQLFVFILVAWTRSMHCYFVQAPVTLSFEDAEALCLFSYHTHLSSIHNGSQNEEAKSLCSAASCWIGLNDESQDENETDYMWTDSSYFDYGTIPSVTPWRIGEPNKWNPDEDCIEMYHDTGEWNDVSCSYSKYPLCNQPRTVYIVNEKINQKQRRAFNSHIIGMVDVLDEMCIEFDVTINFWPDMYGSIIHIGNKDSERYPAIFVNGIAQTFHFTFSHSTNHNQYFETSTINLHQSYHLRLYATQKHLQVYVDNISIYNEYIDSHSILMQRIIYLSDEWYASTNAIVSNLIISNSNSHEPNPFNYLCDYNNRFSIAKGNSFHAWIIDESQCILTQNDWAAHGNSVWLGDKDTTSIDWTDYNIEVIINIASNGIAGMAGIFIRAQNSPNCNNCGQQYCVSLKANDNKITLAKFNNGFSELYAYNIQINRNTDYRLRIEIFGDIFNIYLDNRFLFEYVHTDYKYGSVGLRTYQAKVVFKSMRITFPRTANLTLRPSMSPTATTIYPTVSPTNANMIIYYGVTISIVFDYNINSKNITLDDVNELLNNITLTLINERINTIPNECVFTNDYDIIIGNTKENNSVINATVFLCDKSTQTLLVTDFNN
eukprot:144347_1